MDTKFRTSLPKKFVENTIALCGERGEKWLDTLPETIAELEKKWPIKAGNPFLNLSYNYVANAELADGKSSVLKIGLPLTDIEIFGEAAYLQTIGGDGAVPRTEESRSL